MGEVVRHAYWTRQRRLPLRVPRRRSTMPALLAVAIVLGAAIGYFAFDFLSIDFKETATLRDPLPAVIRGASPGVRPVDPPAGAPASFRRCAGASQRNCVIDGDTIRYGGMTIRLADIDAPEVISPKCPSEAALGARATQRLLELLNAGSIAVVRTGDRDQDAYGRKLRIVERNGRSVGDTLVAEGLAHRWDGARRSWCG